MKSLGTFRLRFLVRFLIYLHSIGEVEYVGRENFVHIYGVLYGIYLLAWNCDFNVADNSFQDTSIFYHFTC